MRLGILQCDSVAADLQPEFGDYPDMHCALMTNDALQPSFRVYDLTAGQFPASTADCDAWLFTGSTWSTYDTDEWISHAHDLARTLHAERRPTIGVCFGHQLICRALGATVDKADAGWGVGVHTARIVEQRPWMQPRREALSLLVCHQDQVIEPPAEADLLASHPFCPHDMFQIGEHILTLQGHPEFPKGYSRALMERRRAVIGESTYRDGMASLQQPIESAVAAAWMTGFLQRGLAAPG